MPDSPQTAFQSRQRSQILGPGLSKECPAPAGCSRDEPGDQTFNNDWVMGRKPLGQREAQGPRLGTTTSVSSRITNPFQTLRTLEIDMLLTKSVK